MDKIKVHGKAQNRTVLGIVKAYMVMYPHATLADLRKAFPNSLNPDKGVNENFVIQGDPGTSANWNGYFQKDEEVLLMGDGKKVAVVSMWTKNSFQQIVDWAKQYGIVVASFEEAGKIGEKGGYRLEYLNGYVPPVAGKKRLPWWLWLLILIIILILAALFITMCSKSNQPKVIEKTKVVEKVVVLHDTVYQKKITDLQKEYNAAQFAKNSSKLTDQAKKVLLSIKEALEENPNIGLCIIGHSSEEGDFTYNMKLSKERAKAAVDFLIANGISANRLKYEGKGSTEPIEPGNNEKNRRTEFKVIKTN